MTPPINQSIALPPNKWPHSQTTKKILKHSLEEWKTILKQFPGNHFVNRNPGNGSDVLEYVFRYYQVDTNGDETGTDLTITYLYDPQLGVNDVNKLDLNIQSTMISDVLEMDTMEDLTLQVYDINGKVIMSQNLEAGQQRIDMSQLSTQYYILHFTNNKGVSDVVKVMKR